MNVPSIPELIIRYSSGGTEMSSVQRTTAKSGPYAGQEQGSIQWNGDVHRSAATFRSQRCEL